MALRNATADETFEAQLPEEEALEQLAAFGVLARWVEAAEVASTFRSTTPKWRPRCGRPGRGGRAGRPDRTANATVRRGRRCRHRAAPQLVGCELRLLDRVKAADCRDRRKATRILEADVGDPAARGLCFCSGAFTVGSVGFMETSPAS
jgi:hypothetical protein